MTESRQPPPRVLITAGPTQEPIDGVRFLSNRSSGRMGLALTKAAIHRGFQTTLLLGPILTSTPISTAAYMKRFRTTDDLQREIREEWPKHDVLIMAAAVADYRPVGGAIEGKLKRKDGRLLIELESTPDLLAEAAAMSRPDQVLIGFALAPTAELDASAAKKLRSKRVHGIVANPLETMDAEKVTAKVLLIDGTVLEPTADLTKSEFANWLLDQLPEIARRAKSKV